MISTKDKPIDGRLVKVVEFAARRKLLLQVKLAKLLGPALGAAAASSRGGGSMLDVRIGPEAAAAAIAKLTEALAPESFLQLVQELLADTWIDGKEVKGDAAFDAAFSGPSAFLFKVLGFVLEVNFADFFGEGGIGGLLKRFAPVPPAPSPSA